MARADLPVGSIITVNEPTFKDHKPWCGKNYYTPTDCSCTPTIIREARTYIAIVRGYDIHHSKYHVSPVYLVTHPDDVMSNNEITLKFHPDPLSWVFPNWVTVAPFNGFQKILEKDWT